MFYAFAMISMNKILNLNLFNCGHHKSVNICIVKNLIKLLFKFYLHWLLQCVYLCEFNCYILKQTSIH